MTSPSEVIFLAKQLLAKPSRYYGDGGTIHRTGAIDVETQNGRVVAVWFRCQMLPFEQTEVDYARAREMTRVPFRELPRITGIEVLDAEPDGTSARKSSRSTDLLAGECGF